VLTYKGGPGKTTVATNLVPALVQSDTGQNGSTEKKRVLLIDCDLQGNASSLLYARSGKTLTHVLKREATIEEAVHDTRAGLPELIEQYPGKASMYQTMYEKREGFYMLPSDMQLYTAGNYITSSGAGAYNVLRNAIKRLQIDFDYIIIDHAPSYNAVTEAALLASDELLIPCELTPYCVDGLVQMVTHLQKVMSDADHELKITAIIPVKLDQRFKKLNEKYFKDLEKHFGNLIPTIPDQGRLAIRIDSTVTWAQAARQTVFEYDPTCKAAKDFTGLATLLSTQKVGI